MIEGVARWGYALMWKKRHLTEMIEDEADGPVYDSSKQIYDGFHGDPTRGNLFWVYPKYKPIITRRWDTHVKALSFCCNAEYVTTMGNNVASWRCKGHLNEDKKIGE